MNARSRPAPALSPGVACEVKALEPIAAAIRRHSLTTSISDLAQQFCVSEAAIRAVVARHELSPSEKHSPSAGNPGRF